MVSDSELLLVLSNHWCTLRCTEPHFGFVKFILFTYIPFFISDLRKLNIYYYTVYPLLCYKKLWSINAFFTVPLSLAG